MTTCHLTWKQKHSGTIKRFWKKRNKYLPVGSARRRVGPPWFWKRENNLFSRDVSSEQLLFSSVVYFHSSAENLLKILFLDPPQFPWGGKNQVAEWYPPRRVDPHPRYTLCKSGQRSLLDTIVRIIAMQRVILNKSLPSTTLLIFHISEII